MNRWVSCALLLLVALLILGTGLAGGVVLDRLVLAGFRPLQGIPADANENFRLMAEAWNTIQGSYVGRSGVESQTLTYGAISGMVDALGDTGHSRFLSPEMLQEQHQFTEGEFEGIGAYIEMKDGHVVIVAPIDGSPAQQAGLRPGDVIVQVDGVDITGLTLDEARAKILGPAGSSVTLTIMDPAGGEVRDVTLTRARISISNVTWQVLPGTQVAHVRMAAFSAGVTDALKKALTEIHQEGLTGVVLDLRSNPGGLLDEAVGTASQFLASGNVLLEKNALGETTPVPIVAGGVGHDLALVVLVNQGTASASEIVAGALQDGQRATLVGETTFGTGTVLNEFGLSDGSALLLATQEWLTPKGRTIWHNGIAPDIAVELPAGAALLLPEAEAGMTPEELRASGDTQLLRGLELLGGQAAPPEIVIDYRRTGGIGGLDDHLAIDATGGVSLDRQSGHSDFTIDGKALAQLMQVLAGAGFAQLKSEYLPANTCCDLFDYTVTYQGHTVHTMDTAVPEALQPVLDALSRIVDDGGTP